MEKKNNIEIQDKFYFKILLFGLISVLMFLGIILLEKINQNSKPIKKIKTEKFVIVKDTSRICIIPKKENNGK